MGISFPVSEGIKLIADSTTTTNGIALLTKLTVGIAVKKLVIFRSANGGDEIRGIAGVSCLSASSALVVFFAAST